MIMKNAQRCLMAAAGCMSEVSLLARQWTWNAMQRAVLLQSLEPLVFMLHA